MQSELVAKIDAVILDRLREEDGEPYTYGFNNGVRAAQVVAHQALATPLAELRAEVGRKDSLIDALVERGLGNGAFDGDNDPLWLEVAVLTGRDPDTGNRFEFASVQPPSGKEATDA